MGVLFKKSMFTKVFSWNNQPNGLIPYFRPANIQQMTYEFIQTTPQFSEHIALIRLNRPKELNALNLQLMQELKHALAEMDQQEDVRCIIITGNDKAFAA